MDTDPPDPRRSGRTLTAKKPWSPVNTGRSKTRKSIKKSLKKPSFIGATKKRPFWSKLFGPKYDKHNTTTSRLTKAIGSRRLQSILTKEKLTARKVYKQSSDVAQCTAVLGAIVYGTTRCWICGLAIKANTTAKHAAECEHILPIKDAVIYLELHSKDTAGNKLTKLGYGWSHTTCNQEKSTMSPMDTKNVTQGGQYIQVYKVNPDPIENVLGDIFDTTLTYNDTLKEDLVAKYHTKANFIRERTEAMTKKYQNIIDAISGGDRHGHASLVTLAGLASSLHPSALNPRFAKSLYSSLKGFKPTVGSRKKLGTVAESNENEE
jgi:hypothetical protein